MPSRPRIGNEPAVGADAPAIALFNDTSSSHHFGCKLVMREIDAELARRGVAVAWRSHVGEPWQDRVDGIPRAPEIAAVLVNGEGTIHHTASNRRALDLLSVGEFARDALKVPAFLINATVHEIAPEHMALFRAYRGIAVRDTASRDLLAAAGVACQVVPDLSIGAALQDSPELRRGVGATDSVVRDVARAMKRTARGRGWSYWPMNYRARPSPRRWPRIDRHLPALAGVALGLRDPVAAFARFVRRHDLMVTGRYHAVAYCLATETPFVAVESNTPKISSLIRDAVGDLRRVIPVDRLQTLDVAEFSSWADSERGQIAGFRKMARTAAADMFDRIFRTVEESR